MAEADSTDVRLSIHDAIHYVAAYSVLIGYVALALACFYAAADLAGSLHRNPSVLVGLGNGPGCEATSDVFTPRDQFQIRERVVELVVVDVVHLEAVRDHSSMREPYESVEQAPELATAVREADSDVGLLLMGSTDEFVFDRPPFRLRPRAARPDRPPDSYAESVFSNRSNDILVFGGGDHASAYHRKVMD